MFQLEGRTQLNTLISVYTNEYTQRNLELLKRKGYKMTGENHINDHRVIYSYNLVRCVFNNDLGGMKESLKRFASSLYKGVLIEHQLVNEKGYITKQYYAWSTQE